jgi:hypothetical protein
MGYMIVACLLYLSIGCADDTASKLDYLPIGAALDWTNAKGLHEGTSVSCRALTDDTGECEITLPEPRKGALSAEFPDDILHLYCVMGEGCRPRQKGQS